MKPTQIWKNFRLGEELDISGIFIYNGMRRFHEIKRIDYSDEIFEVLYNLSVGFERLLKIAVVLLEHNDNVDQETLEKSLITHNHLDLLNRIKTHVSVNLSSPHFELLNLLGTFYKSLRYDRFSLTSAYNSNKESIAICNLLSKHLKIDINFDSSTFGVANEARYRRFFRRTILKISNTIYKIVQTQAINLNLYTYEVRYGSKAENVFLREIDITNEDVLWKELLIFFMNTKSTSGYLEFLRGIDPINFEPELIREYLDCFQSDTAKALIMDELEHHYDMMEDKGNRLELMSLIAAPNVYFDTEENEEIEI